MNNTTHPILNIAIQAIRKAGNFLVKQYEFFNKKNLHPNHTQNLIDKIYKESNHIIITTIKKFYPLHTIITTYTKKSYKNNNNDIFWIIEYEKYNVNFIKQFPFFALSIAVQYKGQIIIGVIYDPIHNELFSACRGYGAQLNGYRIRVNNTKNLNNTIFTISCSYKKLHFTINLLKKLYNQRIHFRFTGATILDLAYVAVGRVDGCFVNFLKNTNIPASNTLIIRESGGLITNFNKTNNNQDNSQTIIVGNPKIIENILNIL